MNSDNLQAVAHAMGIDHTKVKEKVTWYLFSSAHKTTIGMKIYSRSYDLSIKTAPIPHTHMPKLNQSSHNFSKIVEGKITSKHEYEACLVMINHEYISSLSNS